MDKKNGVEAPSPTFEMAQDINRQLYSKELSYVEILGVLEIVKASVISDLSERSAVQLSKERSSSPGGRKKTDYIG